MNEKVRRHCAEIDRCNQRGGRMLSIVDLLDAGTISIDLAAYSLAAIWQGASFMVGAMPGGAGKTTVMGALLNFVPRDVQLIAADGLATIERGKKQKQRCCYICHEIGNGSYYAYLWGEPLCRYFELASDGHMLATNLHADTYEQAHEQICGENGVSDAALRNMNLMFFLSVRRNGLKARRQIEQVWESDGHCRHRQVFNAASSLPLIESKGLVSSENIAWARQVIEQLVAADARTIEQTRLTILEADQSRR